MPTAWQGDNYGLHTFVFILFLSIVVKTGELVLMQKISSRFCNRL